MRGMRTFVTAMILAVSAGAQGQAGTDEWSKLAAANNLDLKGNAPFHLGMTFQLYDLEGKPAESGSFETWWTGQARRRTVVQLAGLNEDGSSPDGADVKTVRYAYLVSQFIESAIHPVPSLRSPAEMVRRTIPFGKVKLECTSAKPSPVEAMNPQPATVCTAANSTNVLVLEGLGGKVQMLRPKTGKFRGTFVPFDLRIYYAGMDAIAGTLTLMQVYDVPSPQAGTSADKPSDSGVVPISGGVIAGHRIQFVEPDYPMVAKMSHLSGWVLLNALIGKDGTIRRLVPIASTGAMFTESAMESVRQWKYSPYLLNGEPTEVDTTITVNFAVNGN